MFKVRFTSLVCTIAMLFTMIGVFGGTASAAVQTELVAYEDFESYDGVVGEPWTIRSAVGAIAQTEKGQSLLVETSTSATAEIFREWTKPADSVRDFTATFSMNFSDFNGNRSVYTKNEKGEYDIFAITTSGKISIAGVESDKIVFETDTWYIFELDIDAVTGYVQINVINQTDNSETAVDGYCNCNGFTGLIRLNFVFSKPSQVSVTCLDDVEMYCSEEDSGYLIPVNDFEDYKAGFAFKNNQSALSIPYWTYQNAVKNMKVVETDKGNSAFIEPNGWTSFLYGDTTWGVEDSVELKFSIKYNTLNQFVRVCMHSPNDRVIPLEIAADGTLKVFDKAFSASDFKVETGVWYDVSIMFGKASRALVTITGNGKTGKFYSTSTYITDITKIAFLSGVGAAYYLDDIEMKKISKAEIDKALGAEPTDTFIPAENFEGYAENHAFARNQTAQNIQDWTYQNDIKNAKVVKTDKGNSAFMEPNGWTSLMYGNSNWILNDALELKYSIKVSSLKQFVRTCMIYLNDSNRVIPFEISADGSVKVFDKSFADSDFRVQAGYWYDVSLKFSKTGKALVTISGNGDKASFYAEGGSVPDITKITFLSGVGAAYYLDDIEMKATDDFTNTLAVSKETVEAGDVTASICAPVTGDDVKYLVISVINEDAKCLEDVDITVLKTDLVNEVTATVPDDGNYSVKAMVLDYNLCPIQHITLGK